METSSRKNLNLRSNCRLIEYIFKKFLVICITIFKVKLMKTSGVSIQEIKSNMLNISFIYVLTKSSSAESDTKALS